MANNGQFRWADKVRPEVIRRLYVQEARGILDEELIDEVGYALLARCRSILEVSRAVRGELDCPECGGVVKFRAITGTTLLCQKCGWTYAWDDFRKTYKNKQLFGGAALPCFGEYARKFPAANTPREKILLIDRLIHEFHYNITCANPVPTATRAVAVNLIAGNGMREVVDFLESLGSINPP